MALYFYRAFSKEGKQVSGTIDASSVQGAKELLTKQNMYPIAIVPEQQKVQKSLWSRLFERGVPIKDKILFTKQLAVLLKSGVPLLQALELLTDQFEGSLHSILIDVKDDIKQGRSFAQALSKYPRAFDTIYVQLVRAGEASGNLEMLLDRLTDYIERRESIRKRVTSALQYPLIQLGVSAAVVGILLVKVVPQMASMFAEQNKDLPASTVFLVGLSNFMVNYYLFILIGFIVGVLVLQYWRSTKAGARALDQLKLRLPLIKYFARMNAVVQFSQTLGMLTEGGVNLAESLDIVVKIVDNQVLADALRQARDKIIKQGKIAQYLKQTDIFPPIAIYLIQTGEQSGQLGSMLTTVGKNYEEDLGELADGLTAKIGPVLLIVMALIVGFIVISIASPMMEMGELAA